MVLVLVAVLVVAHLAWFVAAGRVLLEQPPLPAQPAALPRPGAPPRYAAPPRHAAEPAEPAAPTAPDTFMTGTALTVMRSAGYVLVDGVAVFAVAGDPPRVPGDLVQIKRGRSQS
jgi:hypothetical protein